jgi:hypothetical protein
LIGYGQNGHDTAGYGENGRKALNPDRLFIYTVSDGKKKPETVDQILYNPAKLFGQLRGRT